MQISVSAGDTTSGIDHYEYYLNGISAKADHTSPDPTWNPTGLTPNKTYNVVIRAYDKAGWSQDSITSPVTTKGELLPPDIDISGEQKNGYYIGDVTITARDTSADGRSRVARIKVQGAGGERTINGISGNFTITTDGTYTISAYAEDANGNKSNTTTKPEFKRDATAPRPTLGTPVTDSSGTIKVTATANESGGSGVASYEFQYKEGSGNWTTKEIVQVTTATQTSCEYTYTGMGDGKTVYIRVLVTDGAGNVGKSAEDNTNGTSAVIPSANTAPVVSIISTSKTTNQISVVAKATDEQGDTLKYTLYTSTNGTNWTAGTTSSPTKAGTQVTINSATLSQYTNYYIKVVAVETTQNPNLSGEAQHSNQIRTYCPGGFSCSGSGNYYKCSVCDALFQDGNMQCRCSGYTIPLGSEPICSVCHHAESLHPNGGRCQGRITYCPSHPFYTILPGYCKHGYSKEHGTPCVHGSYTSHD